MMFLRLMRILKLVRVIRILRVIRVFRELRIMMLSIIATLRTLLWTLICLFMLMFVFGVYLTTSVAEHRAYSPDAELNAHFGTLPRTLLVLFQSTSGGIDWASLTEMLGRVSWACVTLFIVYMCLVMYAIMNILTGVCVNQATRAADDDVEFVIQDALERQSGVINSLQKLFHDADVEGTGALTWSQLRLHLRDAKVRAYFKSVGLEAWDLGTFFELLKAGDH